MPTPSHTMIDASSATPVTHPDSEDLTAQIDALLPQTQCRQCGYEGCLPYAKAIACGEANINQCPPGGEAGIHALAHLLQRPYLPLNPAHGVTKPKAVAVIDEAKCIGCTLCIQACPVDAILGASKLMHTVINEECTGCELCLPPCPVDCIDMQAIAERPNAMNQAEANLARQRHQQRLARLTLEKQTKARTYVTRKLQPDPLETPLKSRETAPKMNAMPAADTDAIKKAAIAAAMARVRAQKTG